METLLINELFVNVPPSFEKMKPFVIKLIIPKTINSLHYSQYVLKEALKCHFDIFTLCHHGNGFGSNNIK